MIDKIWNTSMKCCRFLCHQRRDRSFNIGTRQFPLCARCTGIILGCIIAILCLVFELHLSMFTTAALMLVMFIDWLLQFIKVLESTNIRRLTTGLLGGFGLSLFTYSLVTIIHDKII